MKTTMVNGQKGITLIALIITVIVMLILAGVAISVLTGQDGLFDKTVGAAEKYNQSVANETATLDNLMAQLDQYINGVPNNGGGQTPTVPDEKKKDGSWNATKSVNSPQL